MKKVVLLLVTVLAFNLSNAQSWTKESGGNTFDGKYKTSSVRGVGNDYPYTTPLLVVNKFEEGGVNFYVSGSGYWSDVPNVYFSFNNEPDVLYRGVGQSTSNDSKIVFFNEFEANGKVLSGYEILDKIRKASKLAIRISGSYGKNDLTFSLRGSTVAINYVLPNLSKIIEDSKKAKEIADAMAAEKLKAAKERDSVLSFYAVKILESAKNNKIKDYDYILDRLKSHIDIDVDDADNKFFEDGVTMEVRPQTHKSLGLQMFKKYGYVTLYLVFPDKTEELYRENQTVEMDSPLFN